MSVLYSVRKYQHRLFDCEILFIIRANVYILSLADCLLALQRHDAMLNASTVLIIKVTLVLRLCSDILFVIYLNCVVYT